MMVGRGGGVMGWVALASGTTAASPRLICHDSTAAGASGTGTLSYSASASEWYMPGAFEVTGTLYPHDISATTSISAGTFINSSGTGSYVQGDTVKARKCGMDSIHLLKPYASGLRPANPTVGMMICVDGTGTADSLLVYLGTTWAVIKP